MGAFALYLTLFSLVLAKALNVESTVRRVNLLARTRADPKVGMGVTLTSDPDKYFHECEKTGLMEMFEPGVKGEVLDVDKDGEGTILMKSTEGDEAWVPLKAIVGFESWKKGEGTTGGTVSGGESGNNQNGTFNFGNLSAPMEKVDKSPTDFMYSGCLQAGDNAVDRSNLVKHGFTRSNTGMTASKCFAHCKKKSSNRYFGLIKGSVCFCSRLPIGMKLNKKECDTKCSGNRKESCGGVQGATSYTMMNCKPAEPKKLQMERAVKLAGLYETMDAQSCGQSNYCTLAGSTKMLGTPDECKLACWDAKGSERCHGFTYNAILGRCTFFEDVLSGKVRKSKDHTCYFKKTGFPYQE